MLFIKYLTNTKDNIRGQQQKLIRGKKLTFKTHNRAFLQNCIFLKKSATVNLFNKRSRNNRAFIICNIDF